MKVANTVVMAGVSLLAGARITWGQGSAERGMKTYEDQKCYRCHSVAGKGNAKGKLDDVGTRLSAEELRRWIVAPAEMTASTKAKRKPVMREYPNLPKGDVDDLVAYMVSLKAK